MAKLACVVLAKNGRYAVLVRMQPEDDWTQVESVISHEEAIKLIDMYGYDVDPDIRAEHIEEYGFEDWGDDSPVTVVTTQMKK